MNKTIGVVNNHTGEIYAYLKGYSHKFPHNAWIAASEINQIKQYGNNFEHKVYLIKWDNLTQVVDNVNYSFINIYEED